MSSKTIETLCYQTGIETKVPWTLYSQKPNVEINGDPTSSLLMNIGRPGHNGHNGHNGHLKSLPSLGPVTFPSELKLESMFPSI